MSYPASLASRAATDESAGGGGEDTTEGEEMDDADEDGSPVAVAPAAPARAAITAMADVSARLSTSLWCRKTAMPLSPRLRHQQHQHRRVQIQRRLLPVHQGSSARSLCDPVLLPAPSSFANCGNMPLVTAASASGGMRLAGPLRGVSEPHFAGEGGP